MGLADLHIHSTYSLDGTATVRAVLKKAAEVNLSVIAITDHNVMRGSLEAQELAPAYGISAIPGSEISTASGHLLALFIRQAIPRGLSLEETVHRVADQGGLCIVPHPGGNRMCSLPENVIWKALQDEEIANTLIGVEVHNAGMLKQERNQVAIDLAAKLLLARVGNSDAHLARMIGKGATAFSGRTDQDLRLALLSRTTHAVTQKPDSRLALVKDMVFCIALRHAGWVSSNNHPQAPLQFARQ